MFFIINLLLLVYLFTALSSFVANLSLCGDGASEIPIYLSVIGQYVLFMYCFKNIACCLYNIFKMHQALRIKVFSEGQHNNAETSSHTFLFNTSRNSYKFLILVIN